MNCEDSFADQSSQRKVVEKLATSPVYCYGVVFFKAFLVESVCSGDRRRFMVTSEEKHSVRVSNLQAQQVNKHLQ
jgi:hypothetical protein